MRTLVRQGLLLSSLLLLSGSILAQTATTPLLQPLADEPSRADLFSTYAKDAVQADGESFAFPANFLFPISAQQNVDGAARNDTIFGIDISHHQGEKFPFDKLKRQQVAFVYVKATQGTGNYDPQFAYNWGTLQGLEADKKILRGAYHFLSSTPGEGGADQADTFIDYVNENGKFLATDLPPALDLEWDKTCTGCPDRWTTNHRSAQDIITTVHAFRDRVKERIGRTVLIYTNKSFLKDHGIVSDADIAKISEGAKIWIFDISAADQKLEIPDPKKNLQHDLWQFNWNAKIPGVYSAGLDADVFKGDAQAFEKFAHGD